MQTITTTELRTKTSKLVKSLIKGEEARLIHRSRIIGRILPYYQEKPALTKESIKEFKKIINSLNLPKLSYKEREKRYREHLERKYGKGLPGR